MNVKAQLTRKFHFCADPPAKCAIKRKYLDYYREKLGISNTKVIPNLKQPLQIKLGQLDSLMKVARRISQVSRRIATQPEQDAKMLRTNGFVKRGMASFDKSNREQSNQARTQYRFRTGKSSLYIDHFSAQDISVDFSTIKQKTKQSDTEFGTQAVQILFKGEPPRPRKPQSAYVPRRYEAL